jgi:hypothetical protein
VAKPDFLLASSITGILVSIGVGVIAVALGFLR